MSDSHATSLFGEPIVLPEEGYHEALGRFVDDFSRAEVAAYRVLSFNAKLSHPVAAALLSGVRVSDVMSRLRRLWEAGAINDEDWSKMEPIFQQLNVINGVRDLILHYGANATNDGKRLVSNAAKTVKKENAKSFAVSNRMLGDMCHDLRKIIVHLRLHHSGLSPLKAYHATIEDFLRAPWRYTPAASPPVKSQKQKRRDQGNPEGHKSRPTPPRRKS